MEQLLCLPGDTESQVRVFLWLGHLRLVGGRLGQVSPLHQGLHLHPKQTHLDIPSRILTDNFPDGEGRSLRPW